MKTEEEQVFESCKDTVMPHLSHGVTLLEDFALEFMRSTPDELFNEEMQERLIKVNRVLGELIQALWVHAFFPITATIHARKPSIQKTSETTPLDVPTR